MPNKRPFHSQASYLGGDKKNTFTANQFDNGLNTGIQQRSGRYVNTTAANVNGLFATTAAWVHALANEDSDVDSDEARFSASWRSRSGPAS